MSALNIIIGDSKNLSDDDLKIMFEMYINTYASTGNSVWFKKPRDLLKYPKYAFDSGSYENTIAFAMFQIRPRCNKLSLMCHNDTREGKDLAISIWVELLKRPDFIAEASGAVSWILRNKYSVPIISLRSEIIHMLSIDLENEEIIINEDFDINDKKSHSYVRLTFNRNGRVVFSTKETLFGVFRRSRFSR